MSLWSRLRSWRMRLDEDDFQEEIRAHLAMAERDRIEAGADPGSAHHAARKEFGNLTLATEAARRVWTPLWLEVLRDLASDIRYAIRSLLKAPAFPLIVVSVLTLGIGLDAAVFAMLKSLALTPLAGVERSGRLRVVVRETSTGRQLRLSYPDFQFLREHDSAFTGLMGSMFVAEPYRLGKGEGSRTLKVEFVTGNYFEVLGVGAALGRTLLPSDEIAPGSHPIAVLSHGLWQQEFSGDPGIVGQTIEINRYPLTVVGVADASFHGTFPGFDVEVFVPVTMAADVGVSGVAEAGAGPSRPHLLSDRGAALLLAHGFLRPGTTPEAAAQQTDALWDALARERPAGGSIERLRVLPFRQSPIGAQGTVLPMFAVLTAMGSLVLLIACANIAGLVLARGASRRGELAARLALGATRARIVRLLLVETLVLVVPGTVLGILLAQWGVGAFLDFLNGIAAPQRVFFNVDLDAITLGFAVLIAVLCALVAGVVPALQTSRIDLVTAIKQDVSSRGAPRGRLRTGLVTAQIAVSMVLLIGAGLVMRSVEAAARVYPGFEAGQVARVRLDLHQHGYDEPGGRAFYRSLLEALRAGPGIESVSLAAYDPLHLVETPVAPLEVDGFEPQRGEDMATPFNVVGTEYFRTLRIDLVSGREFEEHDTDRTAPVAIVNRTLAERFWGSAGSALGRRIRMAGGEWRTVVGVAVDVKYLRVGEPPRPYVYLPFAQSFGPVMNVYARGSAGAAALLDEMQEHIVAHDPDLTSTLATPLADTARGEVWVIEWTAAMLFVFGIAGMLLAAMGTYGLVSYTVAQQTREIGIRMALGATAGVLVRAIVVRALRLAATGAVIGLVAALTAAQFLGSVLYGVNATDVTAIAGAVAIVFGTVLAASFVPARRVCSRGESGIL